MQDKVEAILKELEKIDLRPIIEDELNRHDPIEDQTLEELRIAWEKIGEEQNATNDSK